MTTQKTWNNLKRMAIRGLGSLSLAAVLLPMAAFAETAYEVNKRGNDAFKNGDFAAAIELYRTAIQLDPRDANFYYNLGSTLAKIGAWDQAIPQIRTALMLIPKDSIAHDLLGHVLESSGDLDGGIKEERTAISLDPDNPSVLTKNDRLRLR